MDTKSSRIVSPYFAFPGRRRAITAALALSSLAVLPQTIHATTVTSNWTGTTSANWSNAANWSPNAASPSNGDNGVSDYNVIINSVIGPAVAPTLDVAATIDALTLTSNASLAIGSGFSLSLNNLSLSNAGTITLLGNNTVGVASLSLAGAGNTTLTGGGTITLVDSTYSRISGGNLINANNTIQGAGYILTTITNQATIRASGGTLSVNSNIDNTLGTVIAAANGTLSINATLANGTLTAFAGSQINGSGTLSNVTLSTSSALAIQSGANSPTISGTFTNKGNITLLGNNTLGVAALTLDSAANVTLTGGGIVNLADSTFSRITSGNLTNINNTLQGAGTILANVVNQGTIIATGGILAFNGNLNNSTGSLSITANGTLAVNATLTGSLSAAAGAQLTGGGTLSNVTLNTGSALAIQSGATSPTVAGTFTNHGNITLLGNGTLGPAALTLDTTANVSLTGGGIINLTDSTFSRIASGNLTNLNNTLQGAGIILSNVVNQGTIIATGGILSFNGNLNNTAGSLSVTANGTLAINATLTGSLTTAAGSQISGGGTFSNVTLNPASVLAIQSGSNSPTIAGTFTNNGNITILGNGTLGVGALTLDTTANVSLSGGGTINLSNSTFSRISSGNLTNINNIIQGQGTLLANITNQGTLIATGGLLNLNGNLDNTAGTLSVTANGTLTVNATLTGSLTAAAGSQINGGGTLSNVTLNTGSAWAIPAGTSSPTIAGTFSNKGTITILGNGTLGVASITLDTTANVTLTGGGTINLTDSTYSRINSGNLTNLDNTIQGAGTLLAAIKNQGTLRAANGTLSLNGDITGAGNTTVNANASLLANNFSQSTLTNNGNFSMTGNGTLSGITGNGTLSLNSSHLTLAAGSPTITQSNLTTSGTSALNITNNKLIIEPTAPNKPATLTAIQTSLDNGSITSSTLAPGFGIAVVDNAVLLTPFTHFGGLPVDNNSILIAPELLGDSNIDGHVDLNDLNAVLNHLGTATLAWTSGNFDGAATIDLNDLNAVLNNLGVSYAGNATVIAAEGLVAGNAQTPEPGSLAMLGIATLFLPRRRQKTGR